LFDLPAPGPVHRPEPPDTVSGRIRTMAAWALCIAFFYLIPLEWASLEWEWTEKGLWRISEDGEESLLLAGLTLLWALFNLAAVLAFLITGIWTSFAHERKGWIRVLPLRDVVYYFAWVECLITAFALLAEFVPEVVRGAVHQHLLPVAPHAIMILVFLFLFRGGFDRYGFRGASPGGWVGMVAAVAGIYGLVYLFLDPLVTEPVARYFSLEPVSWREESISREIGAAQQSGWLPLLSQGLLVGVIGPVGEEIMFRGILQQSLAERIGQPMSVILTSLLFALFHVDVVMFAPLLVLGLILGILRAVFRNLWAPILFHVVNNCVSVFLDLLS
jgi:membrane protease YdiL (CAAX protease family)